MRIPTICEYCGGKVIYTDSTVIYGRSYGMIYLCTNCNAYVGVHKGTKKPLGTLANTVLRNKRKEAHQAFDALWKTRRLSRSEAYLWLSKQMHLPKHRTHIGYFNVVQCEQVIQICRNRKNEMEVA